MPRPEAAHRAYAKAGFHGRDTSRRSAGEEPQTLGYRSAPARRCALGRTSADLQVGISLVIELRKVGSYKRGYYSSSAA